MRGKRDRKVWRKNEREWNHAETGESGRNWNGAETGKKEWNHAQIVERDIGKARR